ncbi:fructose-6-phosphate aldolase [Caulobacter sp. BK020]|uniref:fructose-6-phosphate aldolase n=1 Tax=Caulobacter sp. BK020 TaxID=2512117 RepID=UPI001049F3A3|nr:fructose-6-phosphate aldolase [Caulobacter sp. BK020]TCS15294.1 transaldolase [Caulobacter sp. BK020]
MQIFLDSTDAELIRHLAATGLVDGVTTNPTLVAKANRSMIDVIVEICEAVGGPVSAEVVAAEADAMIAEGRKLAALASNVVVKLPLTRDGLIACSALAAEGLSTNVTLCFSVGQALLAAKAGATYVSPFIGRLDDYGFDGSSLIGEIRTVYDNYAFETKILAASARSVAHVKAAALAGADCATLPVALFTELFNHPLTASGLKQFMVDWAASGQTI